MNVGRTNVTLAPGVALLSGAGLIAGSLVEREFNQRRFESFDLAIEINPLAEIDTLQFR